VSLICRILSIVDRLFFRVLTQTQSLGTHFAISILGPFFSSWDPRYSYILLSPHSHTRIQMHPCMCMRRYTHMYTPTNWKPVREVSLVSIGKQYNTWQTHTRSFHPTDPYKGFPSDRPICGVSIRVTTSQRDPILPAVHTYMNTCIHTHHTCLHWWHICELVRCSGIWRREQKREGEEDKDREWRWLINDYIQCTVYYPGSPPLLSSKPKPRLPK